MTTDVGKVAIVTKGYHKGMKIVVMCIKPMNYIVRSYSKMPMVERFDYDKNDIVVRTRAPYYMFMIRKSSVRFTGEKTPSLLNKWQPESAELLEKNYGKSKAYILSTYG